MHKHLLFLLTKKEWGLNWGNDNGSDREQTFIDLRRFNGFQSVRRSDLHLSQTGAEFNESLTMEFGPFYTLTFDQLDILAKLTSVPLFSESDRIKFTSRG